MLNIHLQLMNCIRSSSTLRRNQDILSNFKTLKQLFKIWYDNVHSILFYYTAMKAMHHDDNVCRNTCLYVHWVLTFLKQPNSKSFTLKTILGSRIWCPNLLAIIMFSLLNQSISFCTFEGPLTSMILFLLYLQ